MSLFDSRIAALSKFPTKSTFNCGIDICFALLIFYRAVFGNTIPAIIPPRKQVMDAMPEKVLVKEEPTYDPNGIKAERLSNESQAEEVKKTAGKKPTVGPIELNTAS